MRNTVQKQGECVNFDTSFAQGVTFQLTFASSLHQGYKFIR